MWAFAAHFFQPNAHCVQMDSIRNGRFRMTDAIIRNRGQAEPATSVSRRKPFQIHFSEPEKRIVVFDAVRRELSLLYLSANSLENFRGRWNQQRICNT